MFSSSQFDGGFTSSQPTDSAPSSFKSRDSSGVIPLTLKQISEASQSGDENSNFSLDGVDLTNVTVVGMVFDKAEKAAVVDFILDDGTGRIGGKRWVNDNFETKEMMEVNDGMYVRVIGLLKSWRGVKHITAFSVRPVKNFDELTFHYIDCIHTHLQNVKLQKGGGTNQPQVVDSSVNTLGRNGSNESSSSIQISKQYSVDGLMDREQLVLDYLKESSNIGQEKGVHMDELCHKLKLPMEKIKESIRCLEDEGLVYSTIDEFHYKVT